MLKTRLERIKRQRGSALILVLIAIGFGAITIPSALSYANTGLNAARISKEHLLKQYANDGAVEYSLWMIAYNVDGIVDTLDTTNPSYSTSVTLNGITVPTTIEVALSGEGGEPGPMPATESGIHVEAVLEVDPNWAAPGVSTDFTYTGYRGVPLRAPGDSDRPTLLRDCKILWALYGIAPKTALELPVALGAALINRV